MITGAPTVYEFSASYYVVDNVFPTIATDSVGHIHELLYEWIQDNIYGTHSVPITLRAASTGDTITVEPEADISINELSVPRRTRVATEQSIGDTEWLLVKPTAATHNI